MKAESMVNYLIMVSNRNISINLLIHTIIFLSLIVIFFAKDNKLRKYSIYFSILTLSGSVLINAICGGNKFHIITFALIFLTILFGIITNNEQFNRPEKNINTVFSIIFLIIGIWYPEFVEANALTYFFVSPMGIVPCPTLIAIIGLMSLYYDKVKIIQFMIIFMGSIYGIIGTFVFKVYFDIWLIAAVAYLLLNIIRIKRAV